MGRFVQGLGRWGHLAAQAAMLGLNGYAAYANGGKVGAFNYAISAVQVALADGAFTAVPTAPK